MTRGLEVLAGSAPDPFVLRAAGVAAWRLGREAEARWHWQAAQREGPQVFSLNDWVPEAVARDFSQTLELALQIIDGASGRPDPAAIEARLDELADIRKAEALTRAEYEARRIEILQKVQAELDALEAEYQPVLETSAARLAQLEAAIRHDVLRHGANISGHRLQALYSASRVTWDPEGVAHYAAAHPDLLQFRRQGEPSVAIRRMASWSAPAPAPTDQPPGMRLAHAGAKLTGERPPVGIHRLGLGPRCVGTPGTAPPLSGVPQRSVGAKPEGAGDYTGPNGVAAGHQSAG